MDFPKTKELVGQKNYDEWACLLRLNLDSLGLEKYLDNAFDLDWKLIHPKTDRYVRKTKSKVSLIIQSSISSDVRARLIKFGWDPNNRDPKVLFDAIVYMHSTSSVIDILDKILANTPKEFRDADGNTDFGAFRYHIEHHKRQIEALDLDCHKEEPFGYVAEFRRDVVLAIVTDYPNFRLKARCRARLSWEDIVEELDRLASDPDGYDFIEE